jgi:hypothetical protein
MKTKSTQQELNDLTEEELRSLLVKLTDDLQLVRDALNSRAGYNVRIANAEVVAECVTAVVQRVKPLDFVRHEELHRLAAELHDARAQRSPTLSYVEAVRFPQSDKQAMKKKK